MLVLERMEGEAIEIDGAARVIYLGRGRHRGSVRLGIKADRDVTVLREEVARRIEAGEPMRRGGPS